MKKFYAILCIALATLTQLQAQAPQGFNYQATVRNGAGELIINTNVYFKFNVMQGSQTSVPVFTETHYVPTDDLGQVNLVIGQGTPSTGTFSELDWSLGNYYLGIELDAGNGYVAMGTTQLLSVPYALYAENSGNSTPTTPNLEAVLAENNSANTQQIKDLQDPTEAQDAVTKNYVDIEIENNVQDIEQVLTQGNDANGIQLKGIADPTEAQDAVTKAYADALSNSQGLMNFNGWENNQVWQENTTITLTPNSFVFINANNTTLIFPDGQESCCFGDVIYIYVMQEGSSPLNVTLQPNGFPVRTPLGWSSTDIFQGSLDKGLNTIILVGDFWMVGDFDGNVEEPDPTVTIDPAGPLSYCQYAEADILTATPNGGVGDVYTYEWFRVDTPDDVSVGTGSTYTPPTNVVGLFSYYVVITESASGSNNQSIPVEVTITQGPSFTIQPTNDAVCIDGTGTPLTVAYQVGTGTPLYEWFRVENPTDVPVGTSSTYTPPTDVAGVFSYYVVISFPGNGGCSDITSEIADITVVAPIETTNTPSVQDIFVGGVAEELIVTNTTGAGNVTYQWFSNTTNSNTGGSPIPGATNNTYTPPGPFDTVGIFYYYVVISDDAAGCFDVPSGVYIINVQQQTTTVTDQDGNTYDYLTYGDQVWTVDNAEMVTYRDGTPIPQVTDNTEWNNLSTGAWAYYDNDPTKPKLYNWYAVMGIHDTDTSTPNKEFAPEGWHVPSNDEWTTLENYLIANGYNYDGTTTENRIAKSMASTTAWNSSTTAGAPGNDQSLNNSSGFNAFPVGLRNDNDGTSGSSFHDEGSYAVFWSSTESNTTANNGWYVWGRFLVYNNINLADGNGFFLKQDGFSVRFVRD